MPALHDSENVSQNFLGLRSKFHINFGAATLTIILGRKTINEKSWSAIANLLNSDTSDTLSCALTIRNGAFIAKPDMISGIKGLTEKLVSRGCEEGFFCVVNPMKNMLASSPKDNVNNNM